MDAGAEEGQGSTWSIMENEVPRPLLLEVIW